MAGPMYQYPVVFKCFECTLEHTTLEQLENHIWNRHLGTFPFHCALCNYPTLSEKALTLHFHQDHPRRPVEFKRKVDVEAQLRDLIAHSIVVPVDYEAAESSEVLYDEDSGQELTDMETLQPADQEQFDMEPGPSGHNLGRRGNGAEKNLEVAEHWDEQPPNLKRIDEEEIVYLDEIEGEENRQDSQDEIQEGVEVISEVEVEDEMEMGESGEMDGMMDPVMEDDQYEGDQQTEGYIYYDYPYEGEEGVDGVGEGLAQYINQHGVYIKSEDGSDIHIRAMKNRHMDIIVRKVAEDHLDMRKKPATIAECDICGKILKYPSRIEAHRRMHLQEKVFQCIHCEKTFSQKSSLNVHMRKHTGEKPFECSWECGKTFASSSAQKMHEKSHSGERKFNCEICGQLFSKKNHVIRHRKSRHPMLHEDELEDEEITIETKAAVAEVVESVRNDKMNKMFMKQQHKLKKRSEMNAGILV